MINVKRKRAEQAKDTGLAIVLIFLIITCFTGNSIYALPALALLVVTMTWPAAFGPLSFLWFGFSKILGEIVSRILLGLIFVLIAVPIGMIRKMTGADSMRLKEWKSSTKSMFVEKDHTYQPSDLENPY